VKDMCYKGLRAISRTGEGPRWPCLGRFAKALRYVSSHSSVLSLRYWSPSFELLKGVAGGCTAEDALKLVLVMVVA
jgi:hypothetical protein